LFDFKFIVDKLPGVIYVVDPENHDILYVNKAIQEIFGYTSEECLEKPALLINSIHEDDKERVLQERKLNLNNEEGFLEYRIIHKDEKIRWVRDYSITHMGENGKTDFIFGSLSDISEHKDQLAFAQQNLDELLEESATVIYRCEPSGNFPATFISNNINRQLGYKPEQFTNDAGFWANHIHPDDQEHVFSNLGQLFEKGHYSHEYRFMNGNGNYVWMHDELRLVKDVNGEVKDIIGNWIDISKAKQLELEKAENEQAIQHANKMQAIGTLAGGVAHEFNNMLGIIIGYTEILSETLVPDNNTKKYTSHVINAANRSKEIVEQLLSFSRNNYKKPRAINLCSQITDAINFIKNTIPSSVKLEFNQNCNCKSVLIDPDEFNQIIINLVSNAVHAMNNKGKINISVEEVSINDLKISDSKNLTEGSYMKVLVTDSGCGISNEDREKIFVPFYTTKDVGEGTGMGLALVYSMLESYGGTVNVVSEIGQYTTFELYFPVIDQEVRPDSHSQEDIPLIQNGNSRILFVDDELLYNELASDILNKLGYEVTTFTSSPEALEHFRLDPYAYDLLITDQVMPEILGTELCEAVLQIRNDINIILCSGYNSGVNKEIALSKNIKGYIPKPFTQKDLISEINMLKKH